MYGGKSTALVQKMERYTYAKKKIAFIRPKRDNRGYITHNGISTIENKFKDLCKVYEIKSFDQKFVEEVLDNFEAVFIDEYFMIENCDLMCKYISKREHFDIYFAGLLSTSENTLFPEAIKILPYCDEILKLEGVCTRCGSQHGNYSMYTKGSKTDLIVVGDEDKYECVCRKCYKANVGKL